MSNECSQSLLRPSFPTVYTLLYPVFSFTFFAIFNVRVQFKVFRNAWHSLEVLSHSRLLSELEYDTYDEVGKMPGYCRNQMRNTCNKAWSISHTMFTVSIVRPEMPALAASLA